MKLVIGTVQYGINYGINNTKGIPSDSEILEIFDLAENNSIKYLDTSISYGNAEERIAKLANNKFNIITKSKNVQNSNELISSISTSLSLLTIQSRYVAYLAKKYF